MKTLALACLMLCGCSCATLPPAPPAAPPLAVPRGAKLVTAPVQIAKQLDLEEPIIWACTYDKTRFVCVPLEAIANQICTRAGTAASASTETL